MKTFNSMYIGMCINNDDPEKRGRVQVFVPHIMPALYEGWNKEGKDITLNAIGDNLPFGLTADIVDKLKAILPWAEAASPVMGTSAPGQLNTAGTGNGAGGTLSTGGNFYNQSPVSSPAGTPGGVLSVPGVGQVSGSDGRVIQAQGSEAAIRRLPLSQRMSQTLETGLRGTGLSFRVTSGGQAPIGSGGARTGSTRHDNGNAADGDFIDTATGRVLNPATNSADRDRISAVLPQLRAAGIQGIGWGTDYMGPTRFHLDVVSPAVWGAGGKSANAPAWVVNALRGRPGGLERTSASGDSPSAPVHALSTPPTFQQGVPQSQYGNAANQYIEQPNGPSINLNTRPSEISNLDGASANFKAQYNRVFSALGNSRFVGTVPDDGARYGITSGTREEWAHFFTRLASVESSFNPNTAADINGRRSGTLTSFGLYQMGQQQFNTFGGGNIYDPVDNTNSFVKYAESMYFGSGPYGRGGGTNVLSGRSGSQWLGLAAGYGPLRRTLTGSQNQNESQLLGTNAATSQTQPGFVSTPSAADQMLGQQSTNLTNNTDMHGPIPVQNLNGVAKGLFSFPAEGAMLWVFFREGNPLFPVYFAASYGADEWASAYRLTTSGPGYNPHPKNGEPQSTGGIMNLNGVGGLRWEDTNNPNDRTQDQKSIMFFGEDGSNIFMGRGYNQYYSKYDRRDQVEGDRWETTLGYKEQWVQGDYNQVVMGDQYYKIGNVSQRAADAAAEIQDIIKYIQEPLVEGSKFIPGTAGSGYTSPSAPTSNTAAGGSSTGPSPTLYTALRGKYGFNSLGANSDTYQFMSLNKNTNYDANGNVTGNSSSFSIGRNYVQTPRPSWQNAPNVNTGQGPVNNNPPAGGNTWPTTGGVTFGPAVPAQ